jgi:membrane protease YdiL (CAAX protease family)
VEKNLTSQLSPLSPTLWPNNSFSPGRSLVFLAGGILIFIASGVTALWLVMGVPDPHLSPAPLQSFLFTDLTYVPLAFYFLVGLPWVARRSLRDLGFGVPGFDEILIGLMGAAAMFVVVDLASAVVVALSHQIHEQTPVKLLQDLHSQHEIAVAAVSACAVAPLMEEMIFRAFFFNFFLRYSGFTLAALTSGLLFGLLHGDPFFAVPLAFGGYVLAYVYYRTGSYWAGVITHGAFNGISVVAVFVFHVK